MKGKTQLPIPAGADKVSDGDIQQAEKGDSVDQILIHSIESVVIDWSHQIQEVLKKDSSQPLLEGLNPGPLVEVEFWKAKCINLENIYDQLRSPKTQKMAELLEKTQSSYYPAFSELYKETASALEEAADIDVHLKPLSGHFEGIESTEFDECAELFEPLMHSICLLWSNSRHYCRPARIIVLLQELNNVVMRRASEFLEPLDLFKGEPDESVEKIRTCFNVLNTYEKCYDSHKAKLLSYFKEGGLEAKDWEFSRKMVFARWDKFMERMNMISDLFKTALEMLRLEKVEIGGVKGKALSARVVVIFEEFKVEFDKFSNKKYDPLDPNSDVSSWVGGKNREYVFLSFVKIIKLIVYSN
jgi:dynein heavy chain